MKFFCYFWGVQLNAIFSNKILKLKRMKAKCVIVYKGKLDNMTVYLSKITGTKIMLSIKKHVTGKGE